VPSCPTAVWQVSGGPSTRPYAELFLRHALSLIGPGDAGPWAPERYADDAEGGFVRRFATEVQAGDVFLLRTGISKIRAVGVVAGGYEFLGQFDDVNGWDLQHGRRVRWFRLPEEYDFGEAVFGANPPRLSRIADPRALDYADRFLNSPPTDWRAAPLPPLPPEEPLLHEVPAFLQDLVGQAQDFVGVAGDSRAFGAFPAEDEMIVHFVAPLLRQLGWPPERIAVKWNHVDVALFARLPRSPGNCALVIEAKRWGAGVEGALEQAKRYVTQLGLGCNIVVTDGIRFRLYSAQEGYLPVAYANLVRLKKGALELCEQLRPRREEQ